MATSNNNNYSVLPFYTDIKEQNHRKPYAFGEVYALFALVNQILPFQIDVPAAPTAPIAVYLVDFDSGAETDISAELQGLSTVQIDSYSLIVYPSIMPMATAFEQGRYYLRLHYTYDGGSQDYFSEVFTWVASVQNYLKVEWYDRENLLLDDGAVCYKTPLYRVKHFLYLATELGKPDYTFEEEGEQRDGYFFPTKQLSEKVYRFTFVAPEYICDVMRFIRLSDIVNVYDPYGRVYKCDTFLITPKWLTQGDLASVECEFETNTVAKKVGMSVDAEDIGGDFNNDYNDDYTNVQGLEPAYIPSVARVKEYVKGNTTSCIFGVKGQHITEGYHHIGYLDFENKIEIWQDGTKFIFLYAGKMYAPDSCENMFNGCAALTSLDLSNFNTANVTTMRAMFYDCAALTTLDLSNFNTANVTTMRAMFYDCAALTTLDLSNFNTANVTTMYAMLRGCAALTSLDLSNFDTANVTTMEYMFQNCAALTSLDLSNFDTANVINMQYMFQNCAALTTIYGGDWVKISGLAQFNMFSNCTSLIGGNGTTYSSAHVNAEYARIDRPGTPGYFTQR
jgi:surface protein